MSEPCYWLAGKANRYLLKICWKFHWLWWFSTKLYFCSEAYSIWFVQEHWVGWGFGRVRRPLSFPHPQRKSVRRSSYTYGPNTVFWNFRQNRSLVQVYRSHPRGSFAPDILFFSNTALTWCFNSMDWCRSIARSCAVSCVLFLTKKSVFYCALRALFFFRKKKYFQKICSCCQRGVFLGVFFVWKTRYPRHFLCFFCQNVGVQSILKYWKKPKYS